MRGSGADDGRIARGGRAQGTVLLTAAACPPDPVFDAGFTFLELLIALTILLFSVVAITGVMITSTYMTTTARQKSAMVNAAAGYLERVRQESFDSIGTPGGDPVGDLVPETSASQPFTITITPSAAWGRPEDPTNHLFKTVTLSVAASGGGGSAGSYTSSAIVGQNGTVTTAVTRPTLAGTWAGTSSGNGSNKTYQIAATLTMPAPTFPWTGTASTTFYRVASATLLDRGVPVGLPVMSTSPTWGSVTVNDSAPAAASTTQYWYFAVTTITPLGVAADSGQRTVQSCLLGPAGATGSGSLAVAGW